MGRLSAKKWVSPLLGIGLALVLLAWVLRNTDRESLLQTVRGVSIPLLLLVPACNLLHNCFRSLRWRLLLGPVRPGISFWSLFYSIAIGYAANIVVAGRVGEVVRPAVLSFKEKISLGATMGSMLSDRVLDILSIAVIFVLGVGILGLDTMHRGDEMSAVIGGLVLGFFVLGVPLLVLLAVDRLKPKIMPWVELNDGVKRRLGRMLLNLAAGVKAIGDVRLLPKLMGTSIVMWLLVVLGTWFGLRACSVSLQIQDVMVLLPLLIVGFAVPTPGGAGGYHATMTFGLVSLFGIGKAEGAASSIVIHLAIVMGALLVAMVCLAADGSRVSDLIASIKRADPVNPG